MSPSYYRQNLRANRLNQRANRPFPGFSHRQAKQQGSALVIGIFVITVMFLMSAALINVLEDADEQVSLEVWGTRALFAANSGADRALAQLFPLTATDSSAASCTNVKEWKNLPSVPGFHGCSVVLACVTNTVSSVKSYRITSTATCKTGNCSGNDSSCLRVNRQVEVEARD
ncbi:MSHA biogenesis protein MshP [Shewanella canadensis]|uniref:MSHA biogenesis protein MshP n=1 Tax=Shewanella canadensis TaxID=271096 RepID=A0A3S0IRQ2_9GAMM|nr:MSHA biogenesis protein MshP [Shewanella canadensis]RTR40473.1 MSHA biogenesis protein MshP [Shewanella canadensis]